MASNKLYEDALNYFHSCQDMVSSDPFYEVLSQFLRSGKFCERCQLDLSHATTAFTTASSEVWQLRQLSMTLNGTCGDKVKVTHQHTYNTEEFVQSKLTECVASGRTSVAAAKSLVDGIFDSSVAVSRVDLELLSILNELKDNRQGAKVANRVYQILGVLFKLLRACAPDDHFAESIIRWIYIFSLHSIMLPSDTDEESRGRLLMLIHIIRIQNTFVPKLIPLVQPPPVVCASGAFDTFKSVYLTMLQTILSKPEDRLLFINVPNKVFKEVVESSSPEPEKFVFVDEFDNSRGVSLKPADMEEPSLLQLLAQFEISHVISTVLSDTNSPLPPSSVFDFGRNLVDTLFIGLTTYNSPPFRTFMKSLMFHVCEILKLTKSCVEPKAYEAFFMETFERFASDVKFGFSNFWVDLPYGVLSLENRSKVFCRIAELTNLPNENNLQHAKQFSSSLFRVPLHDAAHLLNVSLALLASPYNEDNEFFCQMEATVITCVVYVSHLLPSASDMLWKIAKPKLLSYIDSHPGVINKIVEVIAFHLSTVPVASTPGKTTTSFVRSWMELSEFFRSMNYSKFKPIDNTWNTLNTWLINSDITSGEYLFSKDIFTNLNWSSKAPGLPLFLDQTCHHRAAITILRWTARNSLSANDRSCAWTVMLRLHLINRNPPQQSSGFSVSDTAPYVKSGEPLACYAALLMSPTITSSVEAFVTEGLPLVRTILDKRYPNEAIHALLLVLGDHYTRNSFEYLLASKAFCELIDRILTCSMVDIVKGWAFESALPKDVLAYGIVGHMRSMNAYMVLEFWMCILGRCSEGFQKAPVMDAIEMLLALTPALPEGLSTLNSVLSKHYATFVKSARKHVSPVRAFVSWIVGLPFSLVHSATQSARWPWFCVTSLSHDLQTEFETSFALRFHERLLASPHLSIDKVFKQAMAAVEEKSLSDAGKAQLALLPTSADSMAIFRLAQFVSQADVAHAATPLAWLLFFRAYLRKPTWSSKGCGHVLLTQSQTSNKKLQQLVASLTTSLNAAVQSTASMSAVSSVAKESHKLYSAMLLWLDEPRLHSADLDPQRLPPAFLPDIIKTLIDPSTDPWPSENLQLWLLLYVDVQEVADNISMFAEKFKKATIANQQVAPIQPTASNADLSSEYDTKPSCSYLPMPNATQFMIKQLFPDISLDVCRDFASTLQILMASMDAFCVFSSWVNEKLSMLAVANEHIIETLPNLCMEDFVEETVSKPCTTLTSYIRPCSSPAILVARYPKAKRIPSQEAAINQYSAQGQAALHSLTSMMYPQSSQAPVQMSVAAIRLETLISKVVEAPNCDENGRSLYYTLATFIDNNPAMWDTAWDRFLAQCMELLGQTFIRSCAKQQQAGRGCLLETIINSIKSDYVKKMMASDLVPEPSSAADMLESIAGAVATNRLSPDFTFTIVSKFDIKNCITELSIEQRSALLAATLRCIAACLASVEFADHCLIDLLINIVGLCLSHSYPELIHAGIEHYVAVTETYPNCAMTPAVWDTLLTNILGTKNANDPASATLLTVDGPVSLQMVDRELRFLSEVFIKGRSRLESSQAWQAAIAPLSLLASRFYCLALDRAVGVVKATNEKTSSFDMYSLLFSVFGSLILPAPSANALSTAQLAELGPCFGAFGDCILHLEMASSEVTFASTPNFYSRLLADYVEKMLEACVVMSNYAKELHSCLGRLHWSHFAPENISQIELIETLCNRDVISSFWTGVICSFDWKSLFSSSEFSTSEAKSCLTAALVRITYNAVLRYPKNTPLGDLVSGCLVEVVKSVDLEILPISVYTELCTNVRSANGLPLPPQVVFAWAYEHIGKSLDSLKDCITFLELVANADAQAKSSPPTEASLARSCEFLRLIGLLLFDCLTVELQIQQAKNKHTLTQHTPQAIASVVCELLKRCDCILSAASSSSTLSYVASRVCTIGIEPLNQSTTFAHRVLPGYIDYFSSASSEKAFLVYWLSTVCRQINVASVAICLAESVFHGYVKFCPSFTWQTAETLINFASCQSSAKSSFSKASAPASSNNMLVSFSSANDVVSVGENANGDADSKQSAMENLLLLGTIAATHNALLIVHALARRAFSAAESENSSFEIRKSTLYTLSDILSKCCEAPKPGFEVRLFSLWSFWLNKVVEVERFLVANGTASGAGMGSLASDLAFVARLTNLVTILARLGEFRSSRGFLGAIGLGTKSSLMPWFHLFVRGTACILVRYYPDCVSSRAVKSSSSSLQLKQMTDSLSSLRHDKNYANYASLVAALVDLIQDASVPFHSSIERILTEFRPFNC